MRLNTLCALALLIFFQAHRLFAGEENIRHNSPQLKQHLLEALKEDPQTPSSQQSHLTRIMLEQLFFSPQQIKPIYEAHALLLKDRMEDADIKTREMLRSWFMQFIERLGLTYELLRKLNQAPDDKIALQEAPFKAYNHMLDGFAAGTWIEARFGIALALFVYEQDSSAGMSNLLKNLFRNIAHQLIYDSDWLALTWFAKEIQETPFYSSIRAFIIDELTIEQRKKLGDFLCFTFKKEGTTFKSSL